MRCCTFTHLLLTYSLLLAVPGPPGAVKAVVKSATSIVVSWKRPEMPNGVVLRYHIYLRSV